MGCNCGGGKSDSAYRVEAKGADPQYTLTVGEARLLRAATGPTTIIRQVPRAEAEEWLAAR